MKFEMLMKLEMELGIKRQSWSQINVIIMQSKIFRSDARG